MSISNAQTAKLLDLIQQVKRLDGIIAIHRQHNDDDFEISQYEARKSKILGELITEIIDSKKGSADYYYFIGVFVKKYFSNTLDHREAHLIKGDDDFEKLLEAI